MLTTAISVAETIDTVYRTIKDNGVTDGIDRLMKDKGRDVLYAQGSMVKLLNKFIIEPKIVVSDKMIGNDDVRKMIKFDLDLFTMLYSRTFDVLTKIHGLSADTSFSLMSSQNVPVPLSGRIAGMESFESIMGIDANDGILTFGNEGKEDKIIAKSLKKSSEVDKDLAKGVADKEFGTYTQQFINEIKINIDVTNSDGEKYRIDIPVMVKATIVYTKFENIRRLVTVNDSDKKFWSRWDEYRAGAIGLKDLIFASDLLKQYKEKRLHDDDNLIIDGESRARGSMSKYVTGGAAGFNKYYQFLIVNSDEATIIEDMIHGKLGKDKAKEEILEQTRSLSISVMDFDFERVAIYIKDLKGSSTMSFKDLAKASKGSDMGSLYKMIVAGRSF